MARPASDIAARICEAARARFLMEGVDGAALRQIAKDAGTNIGMVYYYYKTKDDLFLAAVEDVYLDMITDLTKILGTDLPEAERIAQMYQRLAALSEKEFAVVRLILREALVSSTRLARLGTLFLRGHIPIVMNCLLQGVAQDRLRADLPPMVLLAATLVLGIMPQLVRRQVAGVAIPGLPELPSAPAIAKSMADVLLHGIQAIDHNER
jgi:AcrR family transcriptional regulator